MRMSDWSSDVCSSDLKARLKRARHIDIIEATEARRHEQNLSTAVAQDVADLRLAIDWDDGIADKAADTTSQVDYRGFEPVGRSEEHTSELQSLMRISYAVFCLKKQKNKIINKKKTNT